MNSSICTLPDEAFWGSMKILAHGLDVLVGGEFAIVLLLVVSFVILVTKGTKK